MNKDTLAFFRMVRDFLTVYLPNQKTASPNTVASYRSALNNYLDFSCADLGISLDTYGFRYSSRTLLEKYLDSMESDHGWSIATRNQRLAAIRRFYKYASERDISVMPCYQEMTLIPVKKERDREIEFFSEEALAAILSGPDLSTRKGIRDLMFMILIYDTGARVQEILDLRLDDIHLGRDEKYIVLTGKGRKTRLVPLMEKTVEHLLRYIAVFHENGDGRAFLFYTSQKGIIHQMSQDNASKLVKKYGDMARKECPDVPEHLYLHMFRHSRAMHLYRNGMPMPLLSEWLGHAQMETTIKYYANADIQMKQAAIEKATSDLNPIFSSHNDFKFSDDEETLKRLYGLA